MYSQSLMAGGLVFNMDYRLGELFSIGARALYCIDLGEANASVLEVSGNVRLYFLRFGEMLWKYAVYWQSKWHWFLQLDVGGSFAFYPDYMPDIAYTGLNPGVMAGVRIFSETKTTYIEPYIRCSLKGYIGIGAMFGLTIAGSDTVD
jgi:hypothetical protein